MELVLLQVGDCKEPAALAHMHPVGIALVKQALLHSDPSLSLAGSLASAASLGHRRYYTRPTFTEAAVAWQQMAELALT